MKEIEDIIEYLKTFDSYSDTGAFDEEIKGLMVGSKQLLETVESLKNKIHNWRELDSGGHYDTLRDMDEIISQKVGE